MTDDPNLSELLDDDKLPEEYPPDRPLGVEDPDVIPDHLALGDTVAERAAREEPDTLGPPPGDGGHVGHLVEPDQGMGPDVEADAVASLAEEELDGALAEDDIVGGDPTTRDVATERYEDESAEEAAMHLTDPPPMHDSDGYVDDDDAG